MSDFNHWLRPTVKPSDAVEDIISKTTKKNTHESFEVQGHVVFFEIHGIMMAEWVPSGQVINQHYYIEALMELRECVRRK
jgi:hypothetical protein